MPYTYILKCVDDSYYTGSTQDLELRLAEHDRGEGSRYTAKRLPVSLIYCEEFERVEDAFDREKQVQGWSRKKKEALIEGSTNALHQLAECQNETHWLRDKTPTLSTEEIRAHHQQHYIQSWSVQNTNPKVIAGGEGSWFWDSDGKRYLDFQSQLVNLNLGHQHPAIVNAIKEQAEKLCYIGPAMANDARSELAAMMAEITPGDLTRTLFTTGGAAANENAIRLARHYTGRQKIITRYRSYHGATGGALALTGDPRTWLNGGNNQGVVRMFDPYTYRTPTGHQDPANCPVCQGGPHLEEILMYENPNTVAAVMLETIVGTNGVIVPPDGYLESIREVCSKYGILLICDEVMAGFGRTGKWFACDHWEVVPDILTTAKGINSGYVPLGTMTVSEPISRWLESNLFPGGLTYAGHPLACATGVASIKAYHDENIIERAAESGKLLKGWLTDLMDTHPSIGEVRGKGMFVGVELVKNRETREPLVPFNAKGEAAKPMTELMKFAMNEGLYLSGFSNVIRVTPPLNISHTDLKLGVEIMDRALEIADQYVD